MTPLQKARLLRLAWQALGLPGVLAAGALLYFREDIPWEFLCTLLDLCVQP